jgi:hypothetical protein
VKESILHFFEEVSVKKSLAAPALATICLALGCSISAFAQDATTNTNPPTSTPPAHRHHRHGGLRLGVCIGQTLAQQGIILPPHTPGQKPDPATKAAFKAAMQTCRAKKPAGT